jgi:hypothetical protein
MVLLVTLMSLFGHADQKLHSPSLSEIEVQTNLLKESPEYQKMIVRLRAAIREKSLSNIARLVDTDSKIRMGALSFSELFAKLQKFDIYQNDSGKLLQAELERESDF